MKSIAYEASYLNQFKNHRFGKKHLWLKVNSDKYFLRLSHLDKRNSKILANHVYKLKEKNHDIVIRLNVLE